MIKSVFISGLQKTNQFNGNVDNLLENSKGLPVKVFILDIPIKSLC